MGTRYLTAVIHDGEFKVAQYGQFDGYPELGGRIVLDFLGEMDQDRLIKVLNAARFLTEQELDQIQKRLNNENSDDVFAEYPFLRGEHGAHVLNAIHDGDDEIFLMDSRCFGGQSLFCEFAYVINLDTQKLELYRGFQKPEDNPDGRFAGFVDNDASYGPIAHVADYDFNALPTPEQMNDVIERFDERNHYLEHQ